MLSIAAIVLALTVVPSPWGIVLVLGAITFDVLETLVPRAWSQRRPVAVGAQTLPGRHGIVVTTLAPWGQVRFDGEIWRAHSSHGTIERGAPIEVVSVEGLELQVKPL